MFSERINIQYSIDIDELPTEIKNLLTKVDSHLAVLTTQTATDLKNIPDKELLSLNTLEEVDKFRRRLATMDYILNDITSIMGGYLEFKTKALAPPIEEPAPEEQPTSEIEEPQELHANMLFNDLGELQQKVDQLNKQT